MRVTISVRHCDVAAELRERARARVERLARLARRPLEARVLFLADHGRAAVEVRLHAARGRVHVGRAEAPDHQSALDRAVDRVRRQLDKAPAPGRRRRVRVREAS